MADADFGFLFNLHIRVHSSDSLAVFFVASRAFSWLITFVDVGVVGKGQRTVKQIRPGCRSSRGGCYLFLLFGAAVSTFV